ncbi:hypothetical protein [Phenylobacterium sp.]|uniref:hypothetical protein n=1 Tax=Phenylobacterium sp. TaxID=1871053 RepID=UPI003BA8724D
MRAYTRPILVSGLGQEGESCQALEPIPLRSGAGGLTYTERWLQELLQRNPALLPVEQIEPALAALVPVCMELPLSCGYADNLFMTPEGGIVLVEAKLWRNPEARREVVGQVLDYAKDLASLQYGGLEAAVRRARSEPGCSLFQLVRGPDAAPESEAPFIDAVTRNLRLGRALLIVAGDGVQQSAEQLAEFLQRHVSLHFTFALVEVSLWRVPQTDQVFVQPKVVARTVQIERAVVRMEAGVAASPPEVTPALANSRPQTLSTDEFYDHLAKVDPQLPDRLKRLLGELEERYGVYPDVQRRLSLKWRSPTGREFMLGGVDREGRFVADVANDAANAIGRLDLSHAYQRLIANGLPGGSVRETPKPIGWRAVVDGKDIPISLMLDHQANWKAAINVYLDELEEFFKETESA